jgi:putative cardiolipin synthase
VLLNDGPTALDWRLRAIDSAVEQIDLQTFLWFFDRAGARVLDHLVRAAERGVVVRVMVDDSLLLREEPALRAFAAHPQVQVRIFNPNRLRSRELALRALLNASDLDRLDHRMHNKAMVVDNRVAIVGGRNLADEYFGFNAAANFRDLELLVGGSIVRQVSAAFDDYWNSHWSFPIEMLGKAEPGPDPGALAAARSAAEAGGVHGEESPASRRERWLALARTADTGTATLYVDAPPRDDPAAPGEAPVQVADELVALFDGAQSEIVIVSAYLIPTPDLEGAVERALARGLRVRILTNSLGSNNHLVAHSAYRNYINSLLGHGAELHEVRTDARDRAQYMLSPVGRKTLALHAKALVIDDDKVFIGSANLDPRSLRLNTEMGLLVSSEALNARLRAALEGDFAAENAWRLELREGGRVYWVSGDEAVDSIPANSELQRLEDWFFSLLPIEGEL